MLLMLIFNHVVVGAQYLNRPHVCIRIVGGHSNYIRKSCFCLQSF